ncbi:sn-glycerol-3-phosphate transport system permease protein UgpE [Dictyobacter alpinus]|uniref:sn-glycerol-3-phosphate transport system permease protein UgpE n=1 Tax=Dictyobacter alpinus TaxID=2014873 RepID=A0A402BFX9_9CHLR|nr:carbohydrate ABC transporter permease [Dictyobacter alpinus]GCE30308.1 sn-glycerol-3-phosphate transport system permease protein UgpE [Dictyobacter alpinus]GCE30340.1 sn-glycerol-3-phosphate transport system permease protein UgpE [Dictyobacter alpinus]
MSTIPNTQRIASAPPATQTSNNLQQRRGKQLIRISVIWTYVVLGIISLLILLPFLWLVSSSLKNEFQYYAIPIQWIPNPVMWSNYVDVFFQYNFAHYIFNSIWLAAFAVVATTFSSAIVAYGFARFHFPGRTALFIVLLATMMIPQQMYTIPLYIIFRNLGWVDTYLPIIVPQLFGSAFNIFLFRQFFISLPKEIDEAARIDGCGSFRILWNMILPQSRPVIVVVAIFTFLNSWRDTLGPLIYLSSDSNRTVPLGLLFFSNPFKSVDPQLMAATLVALVVPVILYALGQRYIDSGVAIADVK